MAQDGSLWRILDIANSSNRQFDDDDDDDKRMRMAELYTTHWTYD